VKTLNENLGKLRKLNKERREIAVEGVRKSCQVMT
jgi:hypothetical protein